MGHVPEGPSASLQIQGFEAALAKAADPTSAPDYDQERWLYVPSEYLDYRYILGTKGERPLICVGVNPSTARPGDLDNTLKSVERIALGNGFDSFLMFNVYAQRATKPSDLDLELNPRLHQENLAAFSYVLSRSPAPAVWASWGTVIEVRPWLKDVVRDLIQVGISQGATWYTAGQRSKKGHPHHPLYLRKDSLLEPFDCEAYVDSLL